MLRRVRGVDDVECRISGGPFVPAIAGCMSLRTRSRRRGSGRSASAWPFRALREEHDLVVFAYSGRTDRLAPPDAVRASHATASRRSRATSSSS